MADCLKGLRMRFLLSFAWQDLRSSGRQLWVFCVCLMLGVTLVTASGALYRLMSDSLLNDTRALMGGDIEVEANSPLPDDTLNWMLSTGQVSLTRELNTMMGTQNDDFLLVALLSTDMYYPLYGELILSETGSLQSLTGFLDGHWGLLIDPVLAKRLYINVGDLVSIGKLEMQVRALVLQQPDRRLSANWRGAPALISDAGLEASGLVQPASLIDYEYNVRTQVDTQTWKSRFYEAFPDSEWEVRSFADRSQRIAERLEQIASGLLIVAFSTLFIGGLGVFNSIHTYLQSKLKTLAILKALGLRQTQLVQLYCLQIGLLAGLSGFAGLLIGGMLTAAGAQFIAQEIQLSSALQPFLLAALAAWFFGILTSFTFALPALGRALSVNAAVLFRGDSNTPSNLTLRWQLLTLLLATLLAGLILVVVPDFRFGFGFISVTIFCLVFFETIVRALKKLAAVIENTPWLQARVTTRLAIANLHRPGAPLRTALLSLGTSLTLLVACTLVVTALLRLINTTVPEESPALILYDVFPEQAAEVNKIINSFASTDRLTLSPLVRARVTRINGQKLSELEFPESDWQEMVRDEHKLSYLSGNIDSVKMVEGDWWPLEESQAEANSSKDSQLEARQPKEKDQVYIAMEDREARQMNLKPGDQLRFSAAGQNIDGILTGIYSQKGIQTRFWFEAILSDGALDPLINSYVGTAYMSDDDALKAQQALARLAPNIISVRTANIVDSARELLAKASSGLAVIASISLITSLLVLASVMAAGRRQQIYDASILHSLGTRMSVIKGAIRQEYSLLAVITALFAMALGTTIALLLLEYRLKLESSDLIWLGLVTAITASTLVFSIGAKYLFSHLKVSPSILLRDNEA
ncbi:MAG: putative ABC transport system permease protein [Oleiphilaceae bacterium]|jgi:putative ABC transport system permease protein